jgi:glycosyltransferase involved in cell wall biosynthesis
MNRLAIVVPCYNEEEVFAETSKVLTSVIKDLISKNKISEDSYILFVNDGSKDNTWELIEQEYHKNKYVCGLKLAGNVGHQNALVSGLMSAKENSDFTISIDADLQDDVNVIEEMVDKYIEGYDIVYGVRNNRDTDSFFKKNTALAFYKMMHMLGVRSVYNHADFRLMSKRAVEQLGEYKERNLFLRGIVPLIGYKTTSVYYKRGKREAGESKYPLKKMISFAFDGITSFSIKPITMIGTLGFAILVVCVLAIIYIIVGHFNGKTIEGWSSLIISIWFMGGVQLLSLGIVGQYIGKMYMEVKERPRYNIETLLLQEEKVNE